MPAPTHLIVGLGNPGTDYAATRHNIGFMAVDAVADYCRCALWKKKFKGLMTSSDQPSSLFLKPQTYMNLSGESVGEALRFHKLTPAQTIVFHDDLDLPAGHVRAKLGGGAGGHNGLKSLDAHIGKDYWRVRIGIGRPSGAVVVATGASVTGAEQSRPDVTNYVLGPFAKSDYAWITPLLEKIAAESTLLFEGKIADYAQRIAAGQKV